MEWLLDYWVVLVGLMCLATMGVSMVILYTKEPNEQKIANIKEWLKYAVVEAEKALGGGTGQLKLRMVYKMAVDTFPWLIKFVPFDTFSKWVDDALVWMREQLSNNNATRNYVEGEKNAK